MFLTAIEFPAIDPFVFRVGGFGLRWYALAYIAGLLIGWRYVAGLMKREALWPGGRPPMTPLETEALLSAMAIGVILGGRLGFVLFYRPGYYFENPLAIVKTWEGGMAFHGGFLGAVLAIILFSLLGKRPMLSVGDAVACATPIGLFFGRLANFINGELVGRAWDGPWSMLFPTWDPRVREWVYLGDEVLRHPSQLYQAALEGLLLFLVLRWVSHGLGGLRRPGLCIGVFLAGYGIARIIVENFRQMDDFIAGEGYALMIGPYGVTMGQALSAPMVLAGLAIIFWARRRGVAAA